MGLGSLFVKRGDLKAPECKSVATLSQWIDELPILDLARSATMVETSLKNLASSDFSDKHRYQRLELYYDTTVKISELLYQHFYTGKHDSFDVRRAGLYYALDIHLHLADAFYKLVGEEFEGQLKSPLKQKAAILSLCSYSYALLRSFQLSRFSPKGMWHRMYALYQMLTVQPAETLEKLTYPEKLPFGHHILSPFYTSLALTIINPYQLEPPELYESFVFIKESLNQPLLVDEYSDSAQYCFQFSLDKQPCLKEFFQGTDDDEPVFFVDHASLSSQLPEKEDSLSNTTYAKLENAFTPYMGRRHPREEKHGIVEVLRGLNPFHQFLQGAFSQANMAEPRNQQQFDKLDANSPWSSIVEHYMTHAFGGKKADATETSEWQLVNISENGACIQCDNDEYLEEIAIGALIGMNGGSFDSWTSALVRWLHLKDNGVINIGLEFVGFENSAIYMQNQTQRNNASKTMAILSKSTIDTWQDNVLITPTLPYKENDEVYLIDNEATLKVKLLKSLLKTPHIRIFTFDIFEEQENIDGSND